MMLGTLARQADRAARSLERRGKPAPRLAAGLVRQGWGAVHWLLFGPPNAYTIAGVLRLVLRGELGTISYEWMDLRTLRGAVCRTLHVHPATAGLPWEDRLELAEEVACMILDTYNGRWERRLRQEQRREGGGG